MRRNGLIVGLLILCLTSNTIILWAENSIPGQAYWDNFGKEDKIKDAGIPQKPGGGILLSGDCSDYIDLSGQPLPMRIGGTTTGATDNYGPFGSRPDCSPYGWWDLSGAAPDVTYKWTVPAEGRYTISLCESSYDCTLMLFNFTCPAEPSYPDDFICGNDDACDFQSALTGYWFDQGQEILIVVDGYGNNTGSYVLEISAYKATSIDSFLVEAMETHHLPGMAACAVKDSEIVWTGSYGFANITAGIPVADTTLFTIASVSKTVTGTALMQLWEQDLFELDDDINHYLPPELQVHNPYFPVDSITFRMLLTHTSSIHDNWSVFNPLISWGSDSPIPLDTFLVNYLVPGGYYYSGTNYNNQQPGTEWEYCNAAVALIGYLVEALSDTISGSSFAQHCQDSIFTPLDMYETSWFLSDLNLNNLAIPYNWSGYSYVPYQHYGAPFYPAGFIRTSTLQLGRFLIAFMNYGLIDGVRILDSTTVDLMTTIQPGVYPPSYKQGFIWGYCNFNGRLVWGHTGGYHGIRTSIFYMPENNTGIIVFANQWDSLEEFIVEIVYELLEYAVGWPYGYIAGNVSDISMSPIEGVYVTTEGPGSSDITDINGEYMLYSLSPGIFNISFSHDNYLDTTVTGVAVTAGDTMILDMQMALAGCGYAVGDVNGSDSYNGLDITYGVNFFKGTGPDPACPECSLCPDWHYCGDVNGSCSYNGLDITYGVNYFKGGADPIPCPDCPPVE